MPEQNHAVVLFDGVCNLCNASVDFIMRRDKRDYFRFTSLQSEAGSEIMRAGGREPGKLDTMLLYEGNRIYARSTAALRIARRLSGAWPLLYAFIIIPRPLRDLIYNLIAKNRYRLFGKRDTCRVPTPRERAKFLD